jgi:hypothetical protein
LQIDAFTLLNNSFGGSGYDIACAQNNCPYFIILKGGTILRKVSLIHPSKKTFILFILIKNKVAKQQLQTIKITKENINKVLMQLAK